MKVLNAKGKNVLFISDLHAPYEHIDAYRFLKAIKKKFLDKNSIIINLGDEIDGHRLSFHDSIEELYSGHTELIEARKGLYELHQLFPKMFICDSNHGSLAIRRLKHHGIPIAYLKSNQDLYGTSKWEWHEDYKLQTLLGDVYVCHGKSGAYGKLCKEVGMSAVQGHFHQNFEISWHNTIGIERFNMLCGCLIDRESLAFAYGKNNIPKPILGVGYLSRSGYPKLIKMELDKKGRWNKKLPSY